MVGGIFQGANQASFSGAITLGTVTTQPASGAFTTLNVTAPVAFRYVRYLAPNSSWGNVAELEFYGDRFAQPVPGPTGLNAQPLSDTQILLAWDAVAEATSYNVKRSLTSGGAYTTIASGVTARSYRDSGLSAGTMYYYVVSAIVSGSETPDSAQAASATLPVMRVGSTETNLVLSWPLASAGFTLQSCTNLTAGGWENVSSPAPQILGDQWQVMLPWRRDAGAVFYRLSK